MRLNPYLMFSGQCEAAFKFYEECLGGKIESMLPYEGSPMEDQVPSDWGKMIMHAELRLDDQILMGADSPSEPPGKSKGFSLSLNFDDPAEAERIFESLQKSGTVQMPIQETFWAARFGMLVDQFGIPWMVNCDQASE